MENDNDIQDKPTPARRPKWLLLLMELRAPFFTASIVPVLLGTALAYYHTGVWRWSLFGWTLAAMTLIHAGANVINDFFDHLSGNDEANVDFVRPFTGGSRMIQQKLLAPRDVLALALGCFAAGSLIGLYLVFRAGIPVLILGVVGVIGGFFYTAPPLNLAARGVGELVIGLNFGVLPVVGTYFIQTGKLRWDLALIALPVAFLIAAVLFINQFQDYAADKSVGKDNWVVRLGRAKSVHVYAVLMSFWALPIIVSVLIGMAPALCLLALIPVILSVKAILTAVRHFDHPRELAPANALTVMTHLLIGVLLSGALVFAGCGKSGVGPQPAIEGVSFKSLSAMRFPPPVNEEEAAYVGVSTNAGGWTINAVKTDVLVIYLFDLYCTLCQEQTPQVVRLHDMIQDSDLKNRARIVGLGKRNTRVESDIFRERYKTPFPLFPDPDKANTKILREDKTPGFFVIDLKNKRLTHYQWQLKTPEDLFERIKRATQ